jgi:hypothetical protein
MQQRKKKVKELVVQVDVLDLSLEVCEMKIKFATQPLRLHSYCGWHYAALM